MITLHRKPRSQWLKIANIYFLLLGLQVGGNSAASARRGRAWLQSAGQVHSGTSGYPDSIPLTAMTDMLVAMSNY